MCVVMINFESRTNKNNENMPFSMKIVQGLMLKHVYILLIFNYGKLQFEREIIDVVRSSYI
jgi:hypothetical protein